MPTRFHEQTLALLGPNAPTREGSNSKLKNWGQANGIRIPDAYLEWAQLGGERILTQYSNMDSFYFEEPEIVTTPDGAQGLLFHQENQGNFQKIAVLDGSDDPPVLFAWIGKPPWVVHASRLSDSIYSQIFDWQFMLEDGEITFYADISLRTDRCVNLLRARYEETVTTHFVTDEGHTTEYRFMKSPTERITVGVREQINSINADAKANIVITGESASVKALEGELFDALSDDVLPPSFSSPRMATGELVRAMLYRGMAQVRHMAIEKPSLEVVARLAECHRARPIDERLNIHPLAPSHIWFPTTGTRFVLGSGESGLKIHFLRQNENWWWIERIEH